jgi:HD-GYP domain-containing protein (c-di-GMP phosphodiesterase class II)
MSALGAHPAHMHLSSEADPIIDERADGLSLLSTRGRGDLVLQNATLEVHGVGGALYSVDGRQLTNVADCGPADSGRDARLTQAANAALRAGRVVMLAESGDGGSRSSGRTRGPRLAVPCTIDDEIVAVMVLEGAGVGTRSVDEHLRALQSHTLAAALLTERQRTQRALEARGDEIAALRGQLDAYALDFRSTYSAEKIRAAELAAALAELEDTYKSTVRGLAVAVEAKDQCTGGHILRVSRFGMMLTKLVEPDHADDVQFQYGFLLHDIGKLTVPDNVLMKPGDLTDEEWLLMRDHPAAGRTILDGIPFLSVAREIVYAHHERWDGKGYPLGLAGDEIPLGAQIFPLCDAFDAITSDRPYRKALKVDDARNEIVAGRGTQFRPDVVDAFMSIPSDELEGIGQLSSSNGDL